MASKSSPSVVQRFRGSTGKRRLAETLLSQSILSGSLSVSTAICNRLKLFEVPANYQLIAQGSQGNDLFFIISGSVRILVNGRQIAIRHANQHVGEMALLDRTAVRSADVVTAETCVIGRISEMDFTRIANRHPILWRRLGIITAYRLRERNRFHPPRRFVPVVFIGSSSESLPLADSLYKALLRKGVEARLWSEGVFQCTRATIEDLMEVSGQVDFAVLVLAPDDLTISRGKRKACPRDNTIFELGLFMGALSRDRTYIISPKSLDLKIPTDLLGVTPLTYQKHRGVTFGRALRPLVRELLRLIGQYGPK